MTKFFFAWFDIFFYKLKYLHKLPLRKFIIKKLAQKKNRTEFVEYKEKEIHYTNKE